MTGKSSGKRIAGTLLALFAATATTATLLPTIAFGGARPAGSHTVTLENTAFHPGSLEINRGDSVTWVWRDGETEHNVTFHGFHSRTQSRGSFTVRFAHSGTFSYDCTLHVAEGMKGKIVVR